jgi:hypothetical protein
VTREVFFIPTNILGSVLVQHGRDGQANRPSHPKSGHPVRFTVHESESETSHNAFAILLSVSYKIHQGAALHRLNSSPPLPCFLLLVLPRIPLTTSGKPLRLQHCTMPTMLGGSIPRYGSPMVLHLHVESTMHGTSLLISPRTVHMRMTPPTPVSYNSCSSSLRAQFF